MRFGDIVCVKNTIVYDDYRGLKGVVVEEKGEEVSVHWEGDFMSETWSIEKLFVFKEGN